MLSGSTNPPRWQLESIYPGLESPEYRDAHKRIETLIWRFQQIAQGPSIDDTKDLDPIGWLRQVIEVTNELNDLNGTLGSFLYCQYSTNTTDSSILGELTNLEGKMVPVKTAQTVLRNTLADLEKQTGLFSKLPEDLQQYRLFIEESLAYQEKQMSPGEEDLAAELSRSGADAWRRLQEQLSSNLGKVWDSRTSETKTVVQLRSMAFDPDRAIRKKAFDLELESWKENEIAFAASLNGVKGASASLNKRRGWASTLDRSLLQNRISRATLDSLIQAMEESLPHFRRYFKTKAKVLGVPTLGFYDIFAPLPSKKGTDKTWSYAEAQDYILQVFGDFSSDLKDFAQVAFDRGWIDAEPRPGKVGGAYCTDMPSKKESRILANFDGSFSSLSTLAHELGHGYHSWVLRDAPALTAEYPMTLAETASIFCETLVYRGAISKAPPGEALSLIEGLLSESTQVIVDILSRFYFESKVFDKRKDQELSAGEFCSLMIDAQKATYGDSLNPDELHPYMWAVKGHYYNVDLAFYNFPYAFGQLFGLALYRSYLDNSEGFSDRYRALLFETGTFDAVEVCRRAGFDIETADFWRKGISAIVDFIDQFEKEAQQE
ncbi:MAG: M3 family oligoendopeptidase [Spirochaetales bacterium]|nr:M3 family oligoendopeptidase [Spirochaetales bacterium]